MTQKQKSYIVIAYLNVGDMTVKAHSPEEAIAKVEPTLIKFFNHGYNGNLHLRAESI